MLQARICVLVALLVGTTFIATAEDYVIPTGVTVLTEEQLLNQIIGNSLMGGNERWVQYFELPSGDQKKGRFKGWDARYYRYEGDWTIHGALMCIHYDKITMVGWGGCYTTALDGDIVTWYETDGIAYYERAGRITLISGNPRNF